MIVAYDWDKVQLIAEVMWLLFLNHAIAIIDPSSSYSFYVADSDRITR